MTGSNTYTLVIGNKNYSSWSLRPWLVLRHHGIPFEEVRVPLATPASAPLIGRYSPSGRVPVLIHGALTVWDSLAILEYLAERHPGLALWPQDPAVRARARAVSAEMHSGFGALREHMTMNIRARKPGVSRAPGVEDDIARILALWTDALDRHGGPFLFGSFGIADAMYAPVATRFLTYGVALSGPAAAYAQRLLELPAMRAWYEDASNESEVIARYEGSI